MSTNPPQIRSYLTYLNFGETILTLVFQSISISSMSYLVYCAAFKRKSLRGNLSASLLVYLILHIMCSTSAVPYHLYTVLNWRPAANNYSPNLLFWLGMLPNTYYFVSPIPVFFLTLDRCLALKAPFFHNNLGKKWITVPTIVVFLTVYGVCIYYFLRELPLDIEKTSICTLFACTLLKIRAIPQQYIKLIMGYLWHSIWELFWVISGNVLHVGFCLLWLILFGDIFHEKQQHRCREHCDEAQYNTVEMIVETVICDV
ncbi:hypothetical protein Ddc_12660 [Ditylenchus destructor]|nr:hypothetical protein Ddc_12660 [Ditylenchus destructor]